MINNMPELIDNLKKGVVDRCRERIIEARETTKRAIATTEQYHTNYRLTSKLKQMREGLLQGL
jgi:hypothetical protein